MGKKRVIKKSQDELIKERENIDQKLKKEVDFKGAVKIRQASVYIYSTYNNTIITLTNGNGDTLFWRSAGSIGFKGTKKGTSFAGSKVAEAIVGACEKLRIREIAVFVKGVGGGRDSALKTLANKGLEIQSVSDVTPMPHNGCRPKKARRV
ncbi:MAG: 30S ribosomal protein S11 [Parcubacteria group bacterium]|nr:30S ribosomal protein S11 [Parcubacteria group bacterium]